MNRTRGTEGVVRIGASDISFGGSRGRIRFGVCGACGLAMPLTVWYASPLSRHSRVNEAGVACHAVPQCCVTAGRRVGQVGHVCHICAPTDRGVWLAAAGEAGSCCWTQDSRRAVGAPKGLVDSQLAGQTIDPGLPSRSRPVSRHCPNLGSRRRTFVSRRRLEIP
jgi:hypothetical protein